MNILRRILWFIAVGGLPLILAGCYGVTMQQRDMAEEDGAATDQPTCGLEIETTETAETTPPPADGR